MEIRVMLLDALREEPVISLRRNSPRQQSPRNPIPSLVLHRHAIMAHTRTASNSIPFKGLLHTSLYTAGARVCRRLPPQNAAKDPFGSPPENARQKSRATYSRIWCFQYGQSCPPSGPQLSSECRIPLLESISDNRYVGPLFSHGPVPVVR
jgi:hypothetical protein